MTMTTSSNITSLFVPPRSPAREAVPKVVPEVVIPPAHSLPRSSILVRHELQPLARGLIKKYHAAYQEWQHIITDENNADLVEDEHSLFTPDWTADEVNCAMYEYWVLCHRVCHDLGRCQESLRIRWEMRETEAYYAQAIFDGIAMGGNLARGKKNWKNAEWIAERLYDEGYM